MGPAAKGLMMSPAQRRLVVGSARHARAYPGMGRRWVDVSCLNVHDAGVCTWFIIIMPITVNNNNIYIYQTYISN